MTGAQLDHAFLRGRKARKHRKAFSTNPYKDAGRSDAWIKGFEFERWIEQTRDDA